MAWEIKALEVSEKIVTVVHENSPRQSVVAGKPRIQCCLFGFHLSPFSPQRQRETVGKQNAHRGENRHEESQRPNRIEVFRTPQRRNKKESDTAPADADHHSSQCSFRFFTGKKRPSNKTDDNAEADPKKGNVHPNLRRLRKIHGR